MMKLGEECANCPGRFLKLTQEYDVSLPETYCEACGNRLIKDGEVSIDSHSVTSGNANFRAVMTCPSWEPPTGTLIKKKSKHSRSRWVKAGERY